MDSVTKGILVVGVAAAAFFGYQYVVNSRAQAPVPTPQQNSPNANQQPQGPASNIDKLAAYGAGIGAGVGALKSIYNDIWG